MSKINNKNENKFDAQNLKHKILTYSAEGASAQARNQKSVRTNVSIGGTRSVQDPWFCGRDVCEILEYSDYRRSLFDHVENETKKSLKDLCIDTCAKRRGAASLRYNTGRPRPFFK